MAQDLLKKNEVRGLSLNELKELLGEPDYEDDNWCYGIAGDDGTLANRVPLDLEVCVSFKEGLASDVGTTYSVKLSEDRVFDPTRWRLSKPSDKRAMTRSLIDSEILINKSKKEVQELLGEPGRKSSNLKIGYDLGARFIDHTYLVFVVDSDRKIIDAKIEEH
jgi:hypothetical protein